MHKIVDLIQGRSFYSVPADQSVYETARFMAEKDIGAVPVFENRRLVGIFSERDIIKRVVAARKDERTTLIREVMTTEVIVATADENIQDVLDKMQKNRCRHMPVVAGAQVIGFLSMRDLLSAELAEKSEEVRQLNTYIYYAPDSMAQ